ncbi:HpcH/HpaI aldolase/citrate lyase family protein [Alisedimentitalea sp. MJ-SS2]|uniref:HpcH/HpaI aldolase family protein n=1 Tax=Aliisedimentitalea sp. MJ-SS2 TaxID=3049795 RepID=UPI002911308A|nr:HpcH/HpaI aldolase/citrate lyase family protein [Alisedimentitalea sp. MJ-SS2]MDU8926373.1 HpcH/HpaI aldolase/citrate lyase family protein [Alisedimentitalea sp. MJ-SS2]
MPAPVNRFKQALKEGKTQIGCWASFGDAYATEILATAGFDWLTIDGEHSPYDISSMSQQIHAIQNSQSEAIVRIPIGSDWIIKQVLDAGCQTILVPMVETAEQTDYLARAMRYPPDGFRGMGGAGARATGYSAIPDYVTTANDQVCLLVQVETVKGMENLDDILAVDGVDGVFIGPADLSADMGHPGNAGHPDVEAAIQDILKRTAAAGKAPCILALNDDTAQTYLDWGAQVIAVGIDVVLFAKAARALRNRWTERLG